MKAIRVAKFGGRESLQVETEVPVPEVGDHDVLVRVMSAGVNPIDTYIRQGKFSLLPNLPYTPGIDAAGYVHDLGSAVTDLSVGDKVFLTGTCTSSGTYTSTGTYAQFVLTEDTFVFPLNSRLNFAQGAAIGIPFFTSYKALVLLAKARPGETVLVHGASGACGIAAIQIARAYGCTVVGTAGTQAGMDVVLKSGAHRAFNHRSKSYEKEMLDYLGKGFDVIIEHVANINMDLDLQMLNDNGRVIVVGGNGEAIINPRDLMMKEATIKGVFLGKTANEWSDIGAGIVEGIEAGWVNPIVDKEYDMDSVQQAHHDIIHSKGAKGKLVIEIAGRDKECQRKPGA